MVELIHIQQSHQLVAVLSTLLAAAQANELSGLVFGATYRGRNAPVMCDAAGTLYSDPIKGMGVAALLAHYLEDVIHRGGDTR